MCSCIGTQVRYRYSHRGGRLLTSMENLVTRWQRVATRETEKEKVAFVWCPNVEWQKVSAQSEEDANELSV